MNTDWVDARIVRAPLNFYFLSTLYCTEPFRKIDFHKASFPSQDTDDAIKSFSSQNPAVEFQTHHKKPTFLPGLKEYRHVLQGIVLGQPQD